MFYTVVKHTLEFAKPVKTSRGSMDTHEVHYILAFASKQDFDRIDNTANFEYICKLLNAALAVGEVAPLKGLSADEHTVGAAIADWAQRSNDGETISLHEYTRIPSLAFALDTLQRNLHYGNNRQVYKTPFFDAGESIYINGLVWMNEITEMEQEAFQKIADGFDTIKFKVGAHDFDEECRLIERIRKLYNSWKLTIRLDANGAFPADDALMMLKELSRFDIHSIEQPIKPKQPDALEKLCRESKVAVALDEELIGLTLGEGNHLLRNIGPQYIIIKPTLLGSFDTCNAWIDLCKKYQIGWWATSALESNIGLNAIAQWTSTHTPTLPQGLGTGKLYTNNIPSALTVAEGKLYYKEQV